MSSLTPIAQFYDESTHKRLRDYVHGNPRAVAAIQFALRHIPTGASHILDIGCGVGWSAWEIVRHQPAATVVGVDLSPRQMHTAQQLFPHPQLSWIVTDMTQQEAFQPNRFDAIVLLDVYEHLPVASRPTLHQIFGHTLKDQGVIILTCPSVFHQHYLRTELPDGLQPVDEDVQLADLLQLAHDIEGEILSFAYQTIWRTNDYTHTIIQKRPPFGPKSAQHPRSIQLEPLPVRRQRVKSQLGLDIALPSNPPSPAHRLLQRVRQRLRGP
ncbi:MAG: class I SAM-dependent methyltransferase [Chloroflexaceae bacterium]|nr:class I SAM-dependent methyltransferase [Chloroflexaceae bacterium]